MSDHLIIGNTVLGCFNCRGGHQLLQK